MSATEPRARRATAIGLALALALGAWLLSRRPEPSFPARDPPPPRAAPALRTPVALRPPSPPAPSVPSVIAAPAPPPAAAAPPITNRFGYCPTAGEDLLQTERPSLRRFVEAHAGTPELTLLARAVEARGRHDEAEVRANLSEAMRLAPDPALALPLGASLVQTPDLRAALAALDLYLGAHPEDPQVARLRARVALQEELQRDFLAAERHGIQLRWAPGSLSDEEAAVLGDEISRTLDRAARLTGTTRRRELTVVVYREHSDLLAVTCSPIWVGGVFDGTLRLLVDPRGPQRVSPLDLAHETLHAQLGETLPQEPVWFHEGLAQYFAGEESPQHLRSYAALVAHRTYIPFSSLNGAFQSLTGSAEAQLAYHQSLAMVELLLDRAGPSVIPAAVRYLADQGNPEGLLPHLAGDRPLDEAALLDYLGRRGAR